MFNARVGFLGELSEPQFVRFSRCAKKLTE
jgi:hypothetical protein